MLSKIQDPATNKDHHPKLNAEITDVVRDIGAALTGSEIIFPNEAEQLTSRAVDQAVETAKEQQQGPIHRRWEFEGISYCDPFGVVERDTTDLSKVTCKECLKASEEQNGEAVE